jgi:hypothetical protein
METEMLSDAHRWPDGAIVIPSDLPEFGAALADAVEARMPYVLVFPDGQQVVFLPPASTTDDPRLAATLDALRKLGPLTSPQAGVDLRAYGESVAATSAARYAPQPALA